MKELNNILSLARGHSTYMRDRIDLIASNSCTSHFARLVMGSSLPNSYCIGLPGARLYGGCTYIDMIEREVYQLVKNVFGDMDHVVVQFLSGMQANIAAYNAVLQPGDTVIAADTKHGGHFSHTSQGPLRFFAPRVVQLPFDDKTYNVDMNQLEDVLKKEKPKLLILGWSEFLFPHPLEAIRALCDKYQVVLLYDMSQVVGLIAGGVFQPEAVRYADIITSSTGKSLHAPDHGLIMYNSDQFHPKVLEAVMPLLTSNTHPQEVAALGIALAEMHQFGNAYAKQVVANTKALAAALDNQGINVLYKDLGYSESHTLLLEHPKANEMVYLLDRAGILTNACQLPWDAPDVVTGLRIGTQVLTRRGYTEDDMPKVADIFGEIMVRGKEPEVTHFSMTQPLAARLNKIAFCFDKDFPMNHDWFEKIFNQYHAETVSSILRENPAFSNCSFAEIESIEQVFLKLEFGEGSEVFKAQSVADSVYFIGHGAVDIVDEAGKTVIRLGVNTHFGELGVLSKNQRRYTAKVSEDALLLKISAEDFLKIMNQFESIHSYFKKYVISLNQSTKS